MPESTGDIGSARPAASDPTQAATATPSQDDWNALRAERDSLRQSVQAVARERDEWKVKAGTGQDAQDLEPYLTPQAGADLVKRQVQEGIQAWQQQQQQVAQQQMAQEQERNTWWGKALKEVPEAADPTNPVFKKALELMKDPAEGLSRSVNGQLLPSYPNAEYVAVLRAKSMLGTSSSASDARSAAQFASAGGSSSGGVAGSGGELSDEDFLKLSQEERRAYQDRKFQEKHGVPP